MNKNVNNYKNTIDRIYASEELKKNTIQKIKQKQNTSNNKIYNYFVKCAVASVIIIVSLMYFNKTDIKDEKENMNFTKTESIATIKTNENDELPRFQNIEELKSALREKKHLYNEEIILEDTTTTKEILSDKMKESENVSEQDYSKTNVQVENVDEADIVKTDGEYIYYIANQCVYIIKADSLEEVFKIDISDNDVSFNPTELYINNNKLIILGNTYEKENIIISQNETKDYAYVKTKNTAEANVFDITQKEDPKLIREVVLDGTYQNSRMIGNNIYFISSKSAYYSENMKDDEILPSIKVSGDDVEECTNVISAEKIVHFPGDDTNQYIMVAGFNIESSKEISVETFLGASDNIYVSKNNLYISVINYESNDVSTQIYKFNLNDSQITLQGKCRVLGNINNQFSMDEYDGYFRIATTTEDGKNTTNQLYIFDNNLNEISKIENIAEGERIYAVRFIGKVGYIVTFKQVDPLFVIDLSDPNNPTIKGELKIPGYSSYLHPYDATHIIGIGYNVKSNGYGGVTNTNIKMSMFDVSDLKNPVEMFNVNIGEDYAYSNIFSNHKILFYKKSENLIGFPVTYRDYNSYNDKDGFTLFKIDMENNKFEKYGEILQKINYQKNIKRAIYIGNRLYTLSDTCIKSYNLENLEKINELEF